MVHALKRVGGRLRHGGALISIRPHRTWRPSIAIVDGGRRLPITELLITPFAGNLESAENALKRVVDDGSFRLQGAGGARWRTYLERPSQLRTYMELITPPRPRFPRGARARLNEIWEKMQPGGRIEITEPLAINVLRKTSGADRRSGQPRVSLALERTISVHGLP